MATVALDNVTKIYTGDTPSVANVSLTIGNGEFLALLGPSGCGKSTLLRMIAGLETVTSGELIINDRPVSGVHPRDRNIAMVFQNYALYPHMTIRENMEYPLKLQKVEKKSRNLKVEEVASLLEIREELDRKPDSLSGGQRQRVAMGRALVREPAVFLMDEPLSNLDARLRIQMRTEIVVLQRKLGITTVYVTHDQVEAMTMADRIVVINKGRVQQIGPPTEIYGWPANLFVAGFMGSPPMNFLQPEQSSRGVRMNGRKTAAPGHPDSRHVVVGIRPEDIHLGQADPDELSLHGTVAAVETLGAETLCHIATDVTVLTVEAGEVIPAAPGRNMLVVRMPGYRVDLQDKPVRLRADRNAVRFFDAESGRAMHLDSEDQFGPDMKGGLGLRRFKQVNDDRDGASLDGRPTGRQPQEKGNSK
ncbi:MAG: sn-glycerol-3-phosphate ABC transporter ATP-binding protein UgpC [bacterium]|nr:sn-glycerol-3-phosphate ABC transporter ATP-binding protein UgpC [Acidimicrobiia bacterium]MCY4649295.1 sn-glycerol-3-phosphate ABC transporter ATP-binding protein UgpC [bacterium]